MIDVETYGAAVGAAKRYTDEHSGSDDAVKYTEQSLTSEQQAQARTNIGAAASTDIPTDAVKYTAQTLTTAQQAQARENIGAASVDSVPTSLAELSDDSTHRLVTDVEKTTWNSTIPSTAKGASNGVAELDSNGKVPSSQLPSFVDDVIEGYYSTLDDRFYEESTFTTLIEPVAGKSWVDIPANKSYRWTGSVYVRVDEGVQIGETSDTAYAGNKGKANADAITAINEVIPSTATSQNPLATAADIPTDAVKYTAQTLTNAQKSQARENIGASDGDYRFLTNTPPLVKGSGTGGNLSGGTSMNTTAKKNSIAYGDVAIATGNYSAAFGYFAQALHDYEIAYGKFNQSNDDTVFSIGDGTDTQNRHNLMELKTNGTLLLNGNAVKTEGGDDDNDYYPMLGQIYKWGSPNYVYGFKSAFSGGYKVIDIIFYSDDHDVSTGYSDVFGDFRVRVNTSASQTTIYLIVPDGAVVDTSRPWIHVQNGYYLFSQCPITANIANAISKFDTSRVKNMARMFAGITAVSSLLSTIDLSSLDTRKVKTMEGMFAGSTAITALDLSSFDMTNVVTYTDMFGGSGTEAGITTLKCPKINPHDDIPLPRTLYSQDGTAYTTLPVTTGTSIELRQSWT